MITTLPKNTLFEISTWLDIRSLINFIQTCKTIQAQLDKDDIWIHKAMNTPVYSQLERIKQSNQSWKTLCKKYVMTIEYPHDRNYTRMVRRSECSYNTLQLGDNCQFSYLESNAYSAGSNLKTWKGIYLIDSSTGIIDMWYFTEAMVQKSVLFGDSNSTKDVFGQFTATIKELGIIVMKGVELFSKRKTPPLSDYDYLVEQARKLRKLTSEKSVDST